MWYTTSLHTLQTRYKQAKLSVTDRASQVAAVVGGLEENLELLCITGVEDQLQVRGLALHIIIPTLIQLMCVCVKRPYCNAT